MIYCYFFSGDPTPVSTPQKKSLAKKIQSDKRSETASPQTEVSLSGSPVETEITTVVDTPVSDQVCELATGNDTGKVNGAVEVSEESDSFDSAEDKLASPEPETSQENGYMEEANHCDNDSEESIRSIPLKPEATNEPTTETEEEDKSNFQINEETNNLTADEVDAEPQDSITENEELEIVTNTAGNDLNDKDFDEFQAFESADPVVDTASSLGESGNTPTDKCPIDDDDDFDDFGAFQSIPQTTAPQPVEQSAVVAPEEEDDDDFGDFAQNSVPVPSKPTSDPTPPALFTPQDSQETTEDFADFQDCSFQSFATPPSATSDFSLIRSKIDTLVKSLFVNDEDPTEDDDVKHSSIDSEISPSSDGTWAKVQDFEGSQGLMFKWLGSLTGTRLLKSLNINTNNIVCKIYPFTMFACNILHLILLHFSFRSIMKNGGR